MIVRDQRKVADARESLVLYRDAPNEWRLRAFGAVRYPGHCRFAFPLLASPGCTQELLALPKTLNLARGHAQPRETPTDPEQMGYSLRA
jgi:hypothetical protein